MLYNANLPSNLKKNTGNLEVFAEVINSVSAVLADIETDCGICRSPKS